MVAVCDQAPGADSRLHGGGEAEQRNAAILESFSSKQLGIINVVSYGYHEYAEGHSLALTDQSVTPRYLEQHRQQELQDLDSWISWAGPGSRVSWVLTVISKADLWWHDRESVFQYYQKGAYAERLKAAHVTARRCLPFSAVIHKFYGTAPVSGWFDETDRRDYRANVIRTLCEAVGRGYHEH